jgi:predicted membrane-bound mannosyltransferase
MHGPWQFIAIAFSYFLLGDSDFSARIPAVLTSIATIIFMWQYRRYLGRAGAIIAAGVMVISPFMLYYGRYVRNEAYVGLFGIVTLWAILRYLDKGEDYIHGSGLVILRNSFRSAGL